MNQIIVFPKNSLSPKDKERLTKEGYFYLEVDDPSKVVTAIPTVSPISGNDILQSAMKALHDLPDSSRGRHNFVKELYSRICNL